MRMKKRICFPVDDIYCIAASSNVKGYPVPNGVAHIHEQSENASVKSKKREFTDFRPFANAETVMESAINHLIMLHDGRQPTAVINIPETKLMDDLNKAKSICDQITNVAID